MSHQKRQYRKRRRADTEAETRLRITESAVELHGTLGPARTSIDAVAKLAGVRRSTVYRHFPDQRSLFAACSSHWAAVNPPPDQARWAGIADPWQRLREALQELYAFYHRTAAMLERVLRDEPLVPVLTPLLDGYHRYLASTQDLLLEGGLVRSPPPSLPKAVLGHALAFPTWRSLVREQGITDEAAVDLMVALVRLVSEAPPSRDRHAAALARIKANNPSKAATGGKHQ